MNRFLRGAVVFAALMMGMLGHWSGARGASEPSNETTTEQKEARMTTVFVVRHAQKMDEADNSSGAMLSAQGRAMAQELGELLASADIAAVFATATQRAKDTGTPTAEAHGVEIQTYDTRGMDAFVERVRREFAGRAVLIVGHSNTAPMLVDAFSGKAQNQFVDGYGDVFVVSLVECEGETISGVVRLQLSGS